MSRIDPFSPDFEDYNTEDDPELDSDPKIAKLRELEAHGIVREGCPQPDYWWFYVIKPLELPEEFREEYLRQGDIRW